MKNNKLIDIIDFIISSNKSEFTGLGIIVYEDKLGLPIESINDNCCLNNTIEESEDISDFLIQISNKNNDCHDGFHLINNEFQLTDISYYFSTPIISKVKPKRMKGSRYRTAFYGSMLKNIICTISISSNFEAFIFINGQEFTLDDYRLL